MVDANNAPRRGCNIARWERTKMGSHDHDRPRVSSGRLTGNRHTGRVMWLIIGLVVAGKVCCSTAFSTAFQLPGASDPRKRVLPAGSSRRLFSLSSLHTSPLTSTSGSDIFEQDGSIPSFPPSRAATSAVDRYTVGPVDPGDDRETRPHADSISEAEIEEVARKWERRKQSRRERITKKKGAREAMLDEAEDVIPDREVPLWYALKVKTGMEIQIRDTLDELATLPQYRGQILETLVPMAKSVKSLGKSLRLVEQPLHRGYVFIHMAMSRDLHDAVLAPNGVGCFIGRRVAGKGIIPNPLRAKEADRLKERALYEAGRTIDLEAIPFRPKDRVDILVGEFAYARGRVTSVKETEVNVAVKRNKVEVRVTLPQSGVRKLTQEELDQEAREAGEEGRRAFDRARGGEVDGWEAIARSNSDAVAFSGERKGGEVVREKKKKAPDRKGPSLYRILSDYVNLENFDPNKPPQVEEMVNGMLELTGQKEDVDGYYREKFENAKKAWEAWKNYLEEKDARRKAGRERAVRRKAMGYDEHNDNWKGPSWVEGREGGREGGGRGWDRQGTGVEEKWVPRAERGGRGDEEEEEGEDKELENQFLDRLMFDLDKTPGAERRGGREGGREGGKERGRGIGRESTLGDDELDALIQSSPVSTPPEEAQRRGGVEREGRFGGRGRGGGAGGEARGGTLSEEEQKELDVWLGMISSGRGTSASSSPSALSLFKGPASLPSSSFTPSPGMGGQPRTKPPSGAKGKDFSLDPEEEKELNEWLNRFDADYKEGADGLRVEKTKSGREEGTEGGKEGGRKKAEGEDAVDRELAELLTKLEAAEISASAGGGERGSKIKGGSGTAPRIPSLGVEGVEAAVGVDSFLSELYRPSKGGKRGKKGSQIEASSGLDSASLLSMALEDVGGRGGEAEIPPISSRSQDARMNTGHRGGEEEEEDERENDETLPASVKRRLFVSRTVEGEDEGGNEGEDEGGDDEEEWGGGRRSSDRGQTRENDLLLGAYSEDPEEAPGQFLEEGLEESVHLGRPRGGGMGGMRQGYMYDDPLGGGRELMSLNPRPGGKGGSRDGRKGDKGDWMRALAEENVNSGNEDIFNNFEDVGDLEELEKLDTLFAGKVGQKGETEGKIRKNRVKRNEDEWGSLLNEVDLGELDEFEEIEKLVNTGRKRQEDIFAEGKSEKRNTKVVAPKVGGRGRESMRLSPSMIEGMKVVDLRAELRAMGLTVSGSKADLQARLIRATQ